MAEQGDREDSGDAERRRRALDLIAFAYEHELLWQQTRMTVTLAGAGAVLGFTLLGAAVAGLGAAPFIRGLLLVVGAALLGVGMITIGFAWAQRRVLGRWCDSLASARRICGSFGSPTAGSAAAGNDHDHT